MKLTLPILPLLLVAFALVVSSCGDATPSTPQSNERKYLFGDVSYPSYGIRYFKDERTGICFAERMFSSSDTYSFTTVPCSNVDAYYKVNPESNSNTTTTNSNTNSNKEKK